MNEYRIDGLTVREHLIKLSESPYRKFNEALNPGVENILGIRIPQLRQLGKRIASDDWKVFLENADTFYMEERMLIGMVIANIKMSDVEQYLHLVDGFVKIINSWSVCDTFDFCGKKSFVRKNSERIWNYLNRYMESDKVYDIRFGVVMTQAYFIDQTHVRLFIEKMLSIRNDAYYVKMAIAWALSSCYIKFPAVTYPYLRDSELDADLLRKTIQKICDSFRVSPEGKEAVNVLRATIK